MPMPKKIISYSILLLTVCAIILFVFLNKDGSSDNTDKTADIGLAFSKPPKLSEQSSETRKEASRQELASIKSGKKLTFKHKSPDFSFEYPEGFSAGEFPGEEVGSTNILVQKNNIGFQLYIRSSDENVELTADIVKQDLPNLTVDQPMQIQIGQAVGLVFLSKDTSSEIVREIWWVHSGHLYQITTYPEFDDVMVEILKSWKFN